MLLGRVKKQCQKWINESSEDMAYKKIEEVGKDFWDKEVNKNNKYFIEEFLSQQHLSKETLKQYESSLKIFAKWIYDNERNVDITTLKQRHGLKYQNYLIGLGMSSSACKFKRSSVSSLCGYIEVYYNEEHPMFRNIYTKAIPNVANVKKKEKIPLTIEELNTLIKALEKEKQYQKLAYLLTAYSSAGRRAEVIQLKTEILNYEQYKDKNGKEQGFYLSHTLRGKGKGQGGKAIRLMISEDAMNAMRKWVDIKGTDSEYIFSNKKGDNHISVNTVNLWVDSFGKIVGRKIFPHLIRASRSTHIVVDEGKDVRFAQKLLNHESSETTNKHYVIRDESEDMGDLFG
jgi:site-specific recombinase XerD